MKPESDPMQNASPMVAGDGRIGTPVDPDGLLNGNELYINRELSQLEFFGRVLQQAADPAVPLLERCVPVYLQQQSG